MQKIVMHVNYFVIFKFFKAMNVIKYHIKKPPRKAVRLNYMSINLHKLTHSKSIEFYLCAIKIGFRSYVLYINEVVKVDFENKMLFFL